MKNLSHTLIFHILFVTISFTQITEEYYFECDCPHTFDSYEENVSLNYVKFHGENLTNKIPIVRDDFSEYPPLEYISISEFYPVAYVSGTKASVSATFSSNCSHPLWIRGETYNNGNEDFIFKDQYVTPNQAGDYYYQVTPADIAFTGDKVNAFTPFTIHWYISPDRNQWHEIGNSKNPLYVTYHEPLYGEVDLLHSTIGNACKSAKDMEYPADIAPAIYSYFKSLFIQALSDKGIRSGLPLGYWTDPSLAETCNSSSTLWLDKNGRSENFADLLEDMIKIQGIDDAVVRRVSYLSKADYSDDLNLALLNVFYNTDVVPPPTATALISQQIGGTGTHQLGYLTSDVSDVMNPITLGGQLLAALLDIVSNPVPGDLLEEEGFLESESFLYVKNYSGIESDAFFLDSQSGSETFDIAYEGAPTLTRLSNDSGIASQGFLNSDPPSLFDELFLIEYNNQYYDASYGTDIANSIEQWESNTLDGYGLRINQLPLTVETTFPMVQQVEDLHYIHKIEDNSTQDAIVE